jgi:hypothetical protein
MDLRKMGINEWRGRARDREVWRCVRREAKAHPGLWRHTRRRRRTKSAKKVLKDGVKCPEV